MALRINTNPMSLSAQRHLGVTSGRLGENFGKLSSGLRINKAADDAAGLAISERMKADIRSYAQAERNAMDGVSMIQVAEGAANEVSAILTRMRELAIESANGTLGDTERGYLNQEFSQLSEEIDRIADITEFDGQHLLDGTNTTMTMQVGINATSNDTISVTLTDFTQSSITMSGQDVAFQSTALSAIAAIDAAIDNVSANRATLGSVQSRLQTTITNLQTARENMSAANSRIRDVDVASETADMTRNNILMQAGVSVLAQANQVPSMALSLLG